MSLIIRHPQQRQGAVCDELVSHIDIFPTVCELMGVERPGWLEGKSFAGYFTKNDSVGRKTLFAEINFHASYEPARGLRSGRYKYVRFFDPEWNRYNLANYDDSPTKDILLENGIAEREKPAEALYDCSFDPGESCNLVRDPRYAQILSQLRDELADFMARTDDPLLHGELPFKPQYKVNKRECVHPSSRDPQDYDPRGRH